MTGASSGLGAAVARGLAAEGASVALLARRRAPLEALAGELGDSSQVVVADVSDPAATDEAVSAAAGALGGLDVVVNAAGVITLRRIDDLDDAEWRRVLDTNLSGSFYVARAATAHLREARDAVIVNIGSDLSFVGAPACAHYCASKAGLLGLTRALAAELAPAVRVNMVCPGPLDTPMLTNELAEAAAPPGGVAAVVDGIPLRRLATPDEVAEAVVFMCASARFATGAAWALDGGTTIG